MRLLSVSILKLARRPAMLRTQLLMLALLALIYLSTAATARTLPGTETAGLRSMFGFPDAYTSLAGMVASFAGLAGAALAGAVAGSEWSWGTFRVAITRGASRADYVVASVAALAVVVLVGWLILFAAGAVCVAVGAVVSGLPIGDPAEVGALARLPVLLAAGWWAVVMQLAIGFAVAFATRSQVAGISAVVGLMFGEQIATAFLVPTDVLWFGPITAAGTLVRTAGTLGADGELVVPLAVTSLYLVAAIVGAALVARRAEVT
jgi:ABC-type transport system involved in multi-copper enzyme maturation permease subunit